jgi:hypothetical protein
MFTATQEDDFSINIDVSEEMAGISAAAAPSQTTSESAADSAETTVDAPPKPFGEMLAEMGFNPNAVSDSPNSAASAAPKNGAMDEFVQRIMEIFAAENVVDKIKEGRQFAYDKIIDYSTSLSKIESDITAVYLDTSISESEASAKVYALGKKKNWILPRIEPLRKAVTMHDIYESALKAYFAKKSGGLVDIVQKINPEVLILGCIVLFEGYSLYQLVATLQPIKAEMDANIRYEQDRITAANKPAPVPQPSSAPAQSTQPSQPTPNPNPNGEEKQPQAATSN